VKHFVWHVVASHMSSISKTNVVSSSATPSVESPVSVHQPEELFLHFSHHAKERMKERNVPVATLFDAIRNHSAPTLAIDGRWRFEYKGVVFITSHDKRSVITTWKVGPRTFLRMRKRRFFDSTPSNRKSTNPSDSLGRGVLESAQAAFELMARCWMASENKGQVNSLSAWSESCTDVQRENYPSLLLLQMWVAKKKTGVSKNIKYQQLTSQKTMCQLLEINHHSMREQEIVSIHPDEYPSVLFTEEWQQKEAAALLTMHDQFGDMSLETHLLGEPFRTAWLVLGQRYTQPVQDEQPDGSGSNPSRISPKLVTEHEVIIHLHVPKKLPSHQVDHAKQYQVKQKEEKKIKESQKGIKATKNRHAELIIRYSLQLAYKLDATKSNKVRLQRHMKQHKDHNLFQHDYDHLTLFCLQHKNKKYNQRGRGAEYCSFSEEFHYCRCCLSRIPESSTCDDCKILCCSECLSIEHMCPMRPFWYCGELVNEEEPKSKMTKKTKKTKKKKK